jgi:hypothetical protein
MAIDESAIRKALGGVEELVGDRLPLARMDVPAHDRRATFGEYPSKRRRRIKRYDAAIEDGRVLVDS